MVQSSQRSRPAWAVAGLTLLLTTAGLAGCTNRSGGDGASPTSPSASSSYGAATASAGATVGKLNALGDTSADSRYAQFYNQKLDWKRCGGLTCTTVKVPLDWTNPGGATIELALNRRSASSSHKLGSLLYNPGGPGGSGVEFVKAVSPVAPSVAKQYDVVGFDPRGVGKSHPVDCLSDKELDTFLAADFDPATPEGLNRVAAADKKFGEGCQARTGDLIGHVDTWSAARDLDVIRAAVGDAKLNFLGQSYGTLLGATYAGFYPQRVGRFVLDGALDPSSSNAELSKVQAQGFETNLRDYMKACLAGETGSCPFSGTVDQGMAQVKKMLDQLDNAPLKVGNRQLAAPLAISGIVYPLYDETSWFMLSQAFAGLKQGDGRSLISLADQYNQREDNGSYANNGNSVESFYAINCLDYPAVQTSTAQLKTQAAQVASVAPTLGKWFAYSDVFCQNYPVKNVRTPAKISASGSGPILVVGTTRDPATPYKWAQALAQQLSNATLLTYTGDGHTAYNRASDCIDKDVNAYLLTGAMPAKGTVCGA